jgi:hypothetical protein
MPNWVLHSVNALFFVFHTALCLFNLVGWAHRRTRRLHMATMGAVAISWFAFGIWKGFGYCLCTDWHMQVRQALGIRDQSTMYVQLMIESVSGARLPDDVVTGITGGGFAFAAVMAAIMNVRDRRIGKIRKSIETS